jgi:hypothetical protein
MKVRRLGAIGECEARTQRRIRSWTLRCDRGGRIRAAERGQAVECFVLIRALKSLFR